MKFCLPDMWRFLTNHRHSYLRGIIITFGSCELKVKFEISSFWAHFMLKTVNSYIITLWIILKGIFSRNSLIKLIKIRNYSRTNTRNTYFCTLASLVRKQIWLQYPINTNLYSVPRINLILQLELKESYNTENDSVYRRTTTTAR